ncbi:hypothetical protein FQA39_LY11483 [Lamprigera yunnana]|nr:hypothetical protein FQA39_LY11483 [Lamprigera yunnana]
MYSQPGSTETHIQRTRSYFQPVNRSKSTQRSNPSTATRIRRFKQVYIQYRRQQRKKTQRTADAYRYNVEDIAHRRRRDATLDVRLTRANSQETTEEKPPSAKTITISSATNSNQEHSTGTKEAEEDNDQGLEQAATKIQAAFRGHKTRSTMKQEDRSAKASSAQQSQQQQQQQQQQQLQEDFENDLSLNDPELTHAATKIQASFRGHMVRKQKEKDEPEQELKKPEEEELDIDLTDPELNKAATKIQASFRGHAVRKEHENAEQGQNPK